MQVRFSTAECPTFIYKVQHVDLIPNGEFIFTLTVGSSIIAAKLPPPVQFSMHGATRGRGIKESFSIVAGGYVRIEGV